MSNEPRLIHKIIKPQFAIEGADVLLQRSFGPSRENPLDPFLLFDHFAFNKPEEGPISGFPTHPHRGIETVTYMLEGNVRHRDSLGNSGLIGPGDIQWMTSGGGIMHEEMPKRGPSGNIFGFQLWVNLPAAEKMSAPRYRGIKADDIPTLETDEEKIRIVAGEFRGILGPITEIAAKPLYMDISLKADQSIEIPIPLGHTAVAYVFEGEGHFGYTDEHFGEVIEAIHMLIFNDGDRIMVKTDTGNQVRFMLIAAAPINEDIVPYGPFVMNTEEEIRQAFIDLQNGNFVKE